MNTLPRESTQPAALLRRLSTAGISNRTIAARLRVHEVTVSRWRSGLRTVTDWRHVDGLREMVAEL